MTRKERLYKTLRGEVVDRPPVSFYEINGYDELKDPDNPFSIYTDPSWQRVLKLARDRTDRIVRLTVPITDKNATTAMKDENNQWDPSKLLITDKSIVDIDMKIVGESRFIKTTINAGSKKLISLTRQDKDINTVWTLEHFLKDIDDFKLWLDLPVSDLSGTPDIANVLETEKGLADTGIIMIDISDPLALIGTMFAMEDYLVIALTEKELFLKALEKAFLYLEKKIKLISKALPGRLWRIPGPELASPPYLPPELFKEYVTDFVTPIVEIIHDSNGFARIHSHGKLGKILDHIIATGCDAIDPIEPSPQGDVELRMVREKYGKRVVLFGNLEVSDIELLPTDQFREKVERAIDEGTCGDGRGFVLMPSAAPYGRVLSELSTQNYEEIINVMEKRYGVGFRE